MELGLGRSEGRGDESFWERELCSVEETSPRLVQQESSFRLETLVELGMRWLRLPKVSWYLCITRKTQEKESLSTPLARFHH